VQSLIRRRPVVILVGSRHRRLQSTANIEATGCCVSRYGGHVQIPLGDGNLLNCLSKLRHCGNPVAFPYEQL
jgi:hypothetical protein